MTEGRGGGVVLISPQCLIPLTLCPVLPCDSSALCQWLRSVLQSLPACPSAQTLPAHLPLSPSNREQWRESRVERASRAKSTDTEQGKREQRGRRNRERTEGNRERESTALPGPSTTPHLPLKSTGVERENSLA